MRYAICVMVIFLTGCVGPGGISEVVLTGSNQFPQVKGEDLTGASQWLPAGFQGKVNVVAIGFERSHQALIEQWHATLMPILAESPEVRFYEVPVIYEMNTVKRLWLNNVMGLYVTDNDAKRRTVTVYTDRRKFAQHLDVSLQAPSLLILDKQDHVAWKSSGPISQLQYMKIRGMLRRLLNAKATA